MHYYYVWDDPDGGSGAAGPFTTAAERDEHERKHMSDLDLEYEEKCDQDLQYFTLISFAIDTNGKLRLNE